MNIESLAVGEFQANCVVAWDDDARAVVFDPGAEAEHVAGFLDRRDLSVSAYMLTHGHIDHISALAELCRTRPAPIGMHAKDADWAFEQGNQMPPFYSSPDKPPPVARLVSEGQTLSDGDLTYTVLETPGHSPGSVCYYFQAEGLLVSGDTLFAGSVGRADLPGGDGRVLAASLKRLAALPDVTQVYSGHGPVTTIGTEKRVNFFLRSCE